jgi:folate-binding protein YgfZ
MAVQQGAPAARLLLHGVHEAAGAQFDESGGFLLPGVYGDSQSAEAEYAAARDGVAVLDLTDRGVLRLSGVARQKLLHSILSHDVASLTPGQGRRAALLEPKGHVLALVRVLAGTDSVDLEVPTARLDLVARALDHYRVAAPVRIEKTDLGVLGVLDPNAALALAQLGVDAAAIEPEAHVEGHIDGAAVRVVRAGDLPAGGYVLHASAGSLPALWARLTASGARPVGRRALDALRVEEGRAWFGPDVTEANLLHETSLLHELHSPTKGCYVGQEIVARLEGRGGKVARALRGLQLGAPVDSGAELFVGEKAVGRVTTAAVSPRLGPIALAYVHRDHFAPGTEVRAGGVTARVMPPPLAATAGS